MRSVREDLVPGFERHGLHIIVDLNHSLLRNYIPKKENVNIEEASLADLKAAGSVAMMNQIQEWRRKLLDQAGQLFERGSKSSGDSGHELKELHAKIGQLTMERDFLEQGLERIHGPRAKK